MAKYIICVVVIFSFFLVNVSSSSANTVGECKVKGVPMKIYHTKDKTRTEMKVGNKKQVTIIDRNSKKITVLTPDEKKYLEHNYDVKQDVTPEVIANQKDPNFTCNWADQPRPLDPELFAIPQGYDSAF